MGLFKRKRKQVLTSPEMSEIAAQLIEFAAATGDDSAAALVRDVAADPSIIENWATAIRTGGHEPWAQRFEVPDTTTEADLLELLQLVGERTEGERLIGALRIALSKREHLQEIDWKADIDEIETAFEALLDAHGLDPSTAAERAGQAAASQPHHEATDEFPGVAFRAAQRGRALALLDINTDSYLMVLLDEKTATRWDGWSIESALKVQCIEPHAPIAAAESAPSRPADVVVSGDARAPHRTAEHFAQYADRQLVRADKFRFKVESGTAADDRVPALLRHEFDLRLQAIVAQYSAGVAVEYIDNEVTQLLAGGLHTVDLNNRYEQILQVLSLSILCRVPDDLVDTIRQRVDDDKLVDGIVDALLASRFPTRPCSEAAKMARPHGFLLDAIQAENSEAQIAALATYLDDQWNQGHRSSRAHWVDGHHAEGDQDMYVGYWCFETAAVAQVLGLDDAPLRANEYYPSDLARGS